MSTTSAATAARATATASKAASSTRRIASAGIEASVGISSVMISIVVVTVRGIVPVGSRVIPIGIYTVVLVAVSGDVTGTTRVDIAGIYRTGYIDMSIIDVTCIECTLRHAVSAVHILPFTVIVDNSHISAGTY